MTEVAETPPPARRAGWLPWLAHTPLYLRILAALALGVAAGLLLGKEAEAFRPLSAVVLRLLAAVATPLIFVAVVNAVARAKVSGRLAARMTWLLMVNTVVAILVGLTVANLLQPGRGADLRPAEEAKLPRPYSIAEDLIGKLPGSVLKPLADNDILGVIVVALAVGIGLRVVRRQLEAEGKTSFRTAEDLLEVAVRLVMVVLHWVIALVPLAVFAVVARVVGTQGVAAFLPLLWFVVAVLLALAIQAAYYLVRLRLGSWVSPWRFLRGGSDALLMAFSTASSAATMPVTYACMKDEVGVREESASIGVLVGGTFNHDGTALYEAMAALFISQVLDQQLGWGERRGSRRRGW
jgi:Na+/H+-dicarboxylate symporter